jgi:septal ring factor EnvC (AmiA/AmiB activator)
MAGVSRVVEVIGQFCWTPLGSVDEGEDAAAAADLETLAGLLESSCFASAERRRVDAHAAAMSVVWRQDPLRLEEQRREQLERELAALAEGKRALAEEKEALAEALAAATSGLEVAETQARDRVAELETQNTEMELLRAQLDDLRPQLVDLQAQLAAHPAAAPRPRRGDLRVCTDPLDPCYGTLQVLLSGAGEPERWEAAVAAQVPLDP